MRGAGHFIAPVQVRRARSESARRLMKFVPRSPCANNSITGTPAAAVRDRGSSSPKLVAHWCSGTCQGGLPL